MISVYSVVKTVCYTRTEMRWLYSFLYTCAFILALPYFVIAGLLKGKYLSTAWERLGNIPQRSERPSIWIHAVSVGELLATKSLIKALRKSFPDVPLFVSTTTITGQRLAQELVPGSSFYFPFDWNWTVRKVFQKIQPKAIVVLETEIWPNFLWTAQDLSVPTILVNGRISDRSMARYGWVRDWLPKFTECWMQTTQDAERMMQLGAPAVFVMGNMKYDFLPSSTSTDFLNLVQQWKGDDLLWIAGSTMPGEEGIVLQAFANLKTEFPLKMLLAPRHPERFAEVVNLLGNSRLKCARRSEQNLGRAEVVLLDSIGELASAYQFADLVLIGGTLLPDGGGHNPIEPAYFGKAILAGPYYKNFRTVFEDFHRNHGICITNDLAQDARDLLANGRKRIAIGEAAKRLIAQNAGATKTVLEVVQRIIREESVQEATVFN